MLKKALSIWAKNIYIPKIKRGLPKKNWTFIKINCLTFLDFLIVFIGGSNQKIFRSFINFFSHFSICWAFSLIFLLLFCTMGKEIGCFSKIIDQNYPFQHWRNLFYHIQILIHHLKVIRHEHLSCLELIIKILPPILFFKYRWHPLMCNTTKNKITVFRPHLQPLIWGHWKLHLLLHLLSYKQQNNRPLLVKNICVFRLTVNIIMLPSVSNQG